MTEITHKPAAHLFLVILAGFLVYSNTFHASFRWDDGRMIVEDPFVKDIHIPAEKLKYDPELYKQIKIRPLGMLTFALNFSLSGLNVVGFHVFNLAVHLANGALVYLLVRLLFQTAFLQRSRLRKQSDLLALLSALFFVVHPVETEAVTYIFQRLASLATCFYLLSVVLYLKGGVVYQNKVHSSERAGTGDRSSIDDKSTLYLFGSLVSALLGMFVKEITFTIPLILIMCELFFFEGRAAVRIARLTPFVLTILVVPLHVMLGLHRTVAEATRAHSFVTFGRLEYLFTQFRVLVTYLRLLILPVHQNIDYDYALSRTILDISVLVSLALLIGLLVIGIQAYRLSRSRNASFRIVAFGIMWFFITASVESVIPLRLLICEYRIYLPSVGLFISAVSLVLIAAGRLSRSHGRTAMMLVMAILMTAYAWAAHARNGLWNDDVRFWEQTITESPAKFVPYYNLAVAYEQRDRRFEAVQMLETVIKMQPSYAEAYSVLGRIQLKMGRIAEAERDEKTALMLDPGLFWAHRVLGVIYDNSGRAEEAIGEFRNAIRIKPESDLAYNDLGVVYYRLGRREEAMAEFWEALRRNADNTEAMNGIGALYDDEGRTEAAIAEFQRALQVRPDDPRTLENIGIAYYHAGNAGLARRYFVEALKRAPDSTEARSYLGILDGQEKVRR